MSWYRIFQVQGFTCFTLLTALMFSLLFSPTTSEAGFACPISPNAFPARLVNKGIRIETSRLDALLARNDLKKAGNKARLILDLLNATQDERKKIIALRYQKHFCYRIKNFRLTKSTTITALTSIANYLAASDKYDNAKALYIRAIRLAASQSEAHKLIIPSIQGLVRLNLKRTAYNEDFSKGCTPGKSARGQVRALLIGVDSYIGNPLAGPSNDAALIKNSLLARGVPNENITVLLKKVAITDVRSAMHKLVQQTSCGDFIVFHFSGNQLSQNTFLDDNSELKAPIGWQSALGFSDFERGQVGRFKGGFIWGLELSEFTTALRNRGGNVFLFLDTGQAAGLGLQHFQMRSTRSSNWRATTNFNVGSLNTPDREKNNDVSMLLPGAGEYAVFYGAQVGTEVSEQKFPTANGKEITYGSFTYALGQILQTKKNLSIAKLAGVLVRDLKILSQRHKGYIGTPIFESSNPDLPFLVARNYKKGKLQPEHKKRAFAPVKIASKGKKPIKITIVKPQQTRGFLPVKTRKFNLVARINRPDDILLLTVGGKQIPRERISSDGTFKHNVILQKGQNEITITAFDKANTFHTKLVKLKLRGALERAVTTGRRYAMIIGNKDYEDRKIADLVTPHADARSLAKVLREKYDFQTEIEKPDGSKKSLLLLNATRSHINKALKILRKRLSTDDMLVVYYAGHGQILKDPKGQIIDAYWIPVNGELDDDGEWISSTKLTQSLRRIKARNVLVIADSCYSGAMSRTLPDNSAYENLPPEDERRRRLLIKQRNMQSRMLMSSGGTEPVLDQGCDGHSIFSCALLKGLEKVDKNIFSGSDLFKNHIEAHVGGSVEQVPQYKELHHSGHEGGDVVFAKAAVKAPQDLANKP